MKTQEKSVRQSVSLPSSVARCVRNMAEKRKASANRVLVDLIEADLRSREAEKKYFSPSPTNSPNPPTPPSAAA